MIPVRKRHDVEILNKEKEILRLSYLKEQLQEPLPLMQGYDWKVMADGGWGDPEILKLGRVIELLNAAQGEDSPVPPGWIYQQVNMECVDSNRHILDLWMQRGLERDFCDLEDVFYDIAKRVSPDFQLDCSKEQLNFWKRAYMLLRQKDRCGLERLRDEIVAWDDGVPSEDSYARLQEYEDRLIHLRQEVEYLTQRALPFFQHRILQEKGIMERKSLEFIENQMKMLVLNMMDDEDGLIQ